MFAAVVIVLLANPQQAEVASYIQRLRPGMAVQRQNTLASQIAFWASKYALDPFLIAALLKQESNFESGIRACWKAPQEPDGETCDHGLGQVNEVWIGKWSLDAEKLVSDDSYNIAVVARVLAWIRRYYGSEPDWYGRYHSGIPSRKAGYLKKIQDLLAQR